MSLSHGASTGLVVSAHSADFIWRAGGAIALYAKRGWHIKVVCLSFGERGESQKLWKDPTMTLERVKIARRAEAERAGSILGVADMEFFDLGRLPTPHQPGSPGPAGRHLPITPPRMGADPFHGRPIQL